MLNSNQIIEALRDIEALIKADYTELALEAIAEVQSRLADEHPIRIDTMSAVGSK